jgi:DNA adenine methylase
MNAATKMLNAPIKWVGGKKKLREEIIKMIPADHTCYVEVFGGAGWVLFGKEPSDVEIWNDIDSELVNFYRTIKAKPEEFLETFDLTVVSREIFEDFRYADLTKMTEMERAHRFYYLIMAGWGGELNLPRIQTSISDAGHGNRLIGAMKTLRKRILPIHERLKTVIIERLDWKEMFERYDRLGVVMYLDPPYPDNNCNYRHNMRSIEEHQELVDRMKQAKCRILLTNFDKPEVRAIYKDFYITEVEFASGMVSGDGSRVNREIIVTNYDPKSLVNRQSLKLA